jgi:hypothetical protein
MAEQILFDKLVFVDRLTRAGISGILASMKSFGG